MAGSLLSILRASAHLVPETSLWVAQRDYASSSKTHYLSETSLWVAQRDYASCSRSHSYPAADSEFQPRCL